MNGDRTGADHNGGRGGSGQRAPYVRRIPWSNMWVLRMCAPSTKEAEGLYCGCGEYLHSSLGLRANPRIRFPPGCLVDIVGLLD